MSHRIPLTAVLLVALTVTLIALAWMLTQGGDVVLSAPRGPQYDWGWQ